MTLTSQEIGDLFEKASVKMLEVLFNAWGYNTLTQEIRRQKSGSQHGFDIYLKIYNAHILPICVFVECKGSFTFNTIDKDELEIKSNQLKRTAFPVKDVHLFFSPTREIDYKNDEISLEDDDNPFCVITMMGSKNGKSDILDLFLSYTEAEEDILLYKTQVLQPITAGYTPQESFESLALKLKSIFHIRLKAFLSVTRRTDLVLVTPSFWNRIKERTDTEKLPNYYLRLDSGKARLREVVANDYHVPNTKAKLSLQRRIKEFIVQGGGLLRILSNGGEGKSTFILDIARELCIEQPVFLLEDLKDDTLREIDRQLNLIGTSNIPIVLIDDAAMHEAALEEHGFAVANRCGGILVILAERFYRYQRMSMREAFENSFTSEPMEFRLNSKENAIEVFERFFTHLRSEYPQLTNVDYIDCGKQFLLQDRYTIAERIFTALRILHQNKRIPFQFDWDEWRQVHRNTSLQNLYLLVAAFYQFGNSITIDFCTTFSDFSSLNRIDVRNAVDSSPNQPLVRNGEYLQLRHEKLAEWYIEDEQQQDNVKAIYIEWLQKIKSDFSKNLLLWTYRNEDFIRCSYLKNVLSYEQALILLQQFILGSPEELHARTEMARILKHLHHLDDAKNILLTIIGLDSKNLHARTELSRIYQQQKKWKEAEDILLELLDLDKENLQARTELSKIYQQQKKWKEAEDILLELLDLNKENLQARTELSKIYQQQKKWKEAEDILLELLDLDKENLQARTELSKIYQQQKKWDDAIKYLKDYILLDNEGLHPRTELSKIYQQQKKWKEAEDILLESLKIDDQQLHPRTELSKIYQQQKKWKEAEDILLESLEIDDQQLHPRTELSRIYQHQKKWKEAEDILLESLKIDDQQLHPRTELSKIYQQQKKWKEAEGILLELLDLDKENLQARTELSKIYQQQKKWKEAEGILLESLEIDDQQLHPRTELSKIYQQQKKWKEAEDILLESLEIDDQQLHPRTELSKIYQQQKKWKEAEGILLELLDLDKENLQARTELSKIYQQQKKWNEAEDILLEALLLDPGNYIVLTEQALLYRHWQREIEEALLKKELSQKYRRTLVASFEAKSDNIPILTEIANLFKQRRQYRASMHFLDSISKVNQFDLENVRIEETIHGFMNNSAMIAKCRKRGEEIVKHDPFVKFRDRFEQQTVETNPELKLISATEKGKYRYLYSTKEKFIQNIAGLKVPIFYNGNVYRNLRNNDEVFYGVYIYKGKVVADCIEPFFGNDVDLIKSI